MKLLKRVVFLLVAALLGGCATGPVIDSSYVAKSQDSRVQYLILHYTAQDGPTSLKTLTNPGVSSHYLVMDDVSRGLPTIYGLVDEDRRSHHAGVSSWKGNTQLNSSSIGIEIVNLGFIDGPNGRVWFDYPPAQVDAVIALVKQIVARHNLKPDRILGHSDIAPQRKTDPGPRFPWKRLADEGLILWPDAKKVAERIPLFEKPFPDMEWFQQNLMQHGFAVPLNGQFDEATQRVIAAFQMKYRPSNFDGIPDAETAALLDVLNSPDRATR
ncbi:MAG: N-acetylmuramoyl-L-alanine amidase [Betaproteobacteria bacterium]|nr:N-acetylmuramoyl-L-alanine amidase [Betaproteobacteria bacterium]